MLLVGTKEENKADGRLPDACRRLHAAAGGRRRSEGMLDRFAPARNPSNQYLRVYSERADG
jgi:hypothetical protein